MSTQQPTRHLSTTDAYALWAQTYDRDPNPMTVFADVVRNRLLPSLRDQTLVELGCGTGRNLAAAVRAGARQVIGVDASGAMLEIATQRVPDAELHACDLSSPIPLTDECGDVVLICLTLEHIQDLRVPLREAARLVRPTGSIVVIEVHPELLSAGARATFRDDEGNRVETDCFVHSLLAYEYAAEASGLRTQRVCSWMADQDRVRAIPLLEKYAGQPVLVSLTMQRG